VTDTPALDDHAMLRHLVDQREIEAIIADYAEALDTRDGRLWLSVFHDDAVYDVDFPPAVVSGHDALRAWAEDVFRFRTISHLTGNHRIDLIDATTAKAIGRGLGLFTLEDGTVMLASARLIDRFSKRDGKWRIAHRKVNISSAFALNGATELALDGAGQSH
jgi:uncharacterized protein (TIGR02246 family)